MARIEASLRSRWTEKRIESLRKSFPLYGIPANHPLPWALDRTGFDSIVRDGKAFVDLRGFPLAAAVRLHDSSIDFSHAKSPKNARGMPAEIRLVHCELDDCLFEHAQNFEFIGSCKLTRCSFRGAHMRKAMLASPENSFEECVFDEADLQAAQTWHSVFRRCSFRGANLKKSELGTTVFEQCDFRGCLFGGGAILATKFIGCNFAGVDLADSMRDEDTLFDAACDLTEMKYRTKTRIFGKEMEIGPPLGAGPEDQ
jgi:uncharacterized protein YjbI with pentapeptide repeats